MSQWKFFHILSSFIFKINIIRYGTYIDEVKGDWRGLDKLFPVILSVLFVIGCDCNCEFGYARNCGFVETQCIASLQYWVVVGCRYKHVIND